MVDLRSAVPVHYEPLVESVRKTGKVLLACDAVERGCVMQTVASNLAQLCFDYLDAPPLRVCARNVPVPYSAALETAALPQVEDLVAAARALVNKER